MLREVAREFTMQNGMLLLIFSNLLIFIFLVNYFLKIMNLINQSVKVLWGMVLTNQNSVTLRDIIYVHNFVYDTAFLYVVVMVINHYWRNYWWQLDCMVQTSLCHIRDRHRVQTSATDIYYQIGIQFLRFKIYILIL